MLARLQPPAPKRRPPSDTSVSSSGYTARAPPDLPVFAGELRRPRFRGAAGDDRKWAKRIKEMAETREKETAETREKKRAKPGGPGVPKGEPVRTVDLRAASLSGHEREVVALLTNANSACNLRSISLESCALTHEQLKRLVGRTLPQLARFASAAASDGSAGSDGGAECSLNLSDNAVTDAVLVDVIKELGQKLKGVRVLHLSHNPIEGECFEAICGAFPRLQELHAHHTALSGAGLFPLINNLPLLRVLNVDSTPCGAEAANQVLLALKQRANAAGAADAPCVPLAVWMRTPAPIDARWLPLLHFVASKKNEGFLLKHNLSPSSRSQGASRNAVKVHDEVNVVLMFPGLPPLKVVHTNMSAVRETLGVARTSIEHLDLACAQMLHGGHVARPPLKQEFDQTKLALLEYEHRVELVGQKFRLGTVEAERRDRYTGEREAECVLHQKLLGPPRPGSELTLRVEAEFCSAPDGPSCRAESRLGPTTPPQ